MSDGTTSRSEFILKAEAIVLENISNEQFGVSQLADAMNMSRSNLLRKIRKDAQLSASQFIRQIRLEKAMEFLREGSLTVSEVSYEVGFGSTSYFIKCFREHYGYPPGEASNRPLEELQVGSGTGTKPKWKVIIAGILAMMALSIIWIYTRKNSPKSELEKSIAVLPFKNESADSTNAYFVNGLMESTLNNLQKIEDLRVVSRTSVEKYRNTAKAIPEIAGELDVNYFVEGSGQKVGDRVMLHIQLIDASSDRPIWSEQYSRKIDDIFTLQNEVARKIVDAIEALVTPEELERIEKRPTENLVAYDYYLQGLERMNAGNPEGLLDAISLFEKAIEHDSQFALAYADIAISYFLLDQDKSQKQFIEQLNNYADKALLYDSKSAESLIAKALYYMQTLEFRLALPHLEKALEYNPNSPAVIQILSDYYARIVPDTDKYLEFALKAIQLHSGSNDSTAKSYMYLHLSNALIQNGFVKEAKSYISKSLELEPKNYYAPLLSVFIEYADDLDADKARDRLVDLWQKDTTRLDILQEVAKFHYFQKRYDSAFYYYEKFVNDQERNGLDIYPQEDIKIGVVYKAMGLEEKAAGFLQAYEEYCKRDQTIYKGASTAMLYSYKGDYSAAIEQLRVFSNQDNIQYWILLFLEEDPLTDPLKKHPEYEAIKSRIENRFWKHHKDLKESLKAKELL